MDIQETPAQVLAEERLQRELSSMQDGSNDERAGEASAVHGLLTRLDLAVLVCQARFAEPVAPAVVVAVATAIGAIRQAGQDTF
ncbi:hypothetical protein [Roseateles cavernae]|uniref:hypothetical protein n=1 Tax=Roseateles cavernae TaxID=3153578 RepID=UPI0032E3A052